MQNLIATQVDDRKQAFVLTETQRELLPLAFGSFLDSVATATGRGTFYNSREEQAAAVEAAHRDLFDIDRDVYTAALMLPGVTDYSRQIGVRRLLQATRDGGILPAEFEAVAITCLVRGLPTQRMLKLFGMLRRDRVNNARTRRLILSEILGADGLEFWAVKYREKLRVALTHAWGRRMASILRNVLAKSPGDRTEKESKIVRQNVNRFVRDHAVDRVEQCVRFVLGEENDVTLDRLAAYRDAKSDFDRGAVLPPETMEGLRSRFHKDRTSGEVLELTKSQLTTGQRIAVQRKAEQSGVEVKFDPARYDAVRLYVYAFEMGMTDAIRQTLRDKAEAAAARLPVRFERVGVLIDASQSMMGHDTQALRPIATALALRDLLSTTADHAVAITADGRATESYELVEPSGDTSLAAGLVQLLKAEPDVVFVLSDGYENAPSGRFGETVAAVRRIGIQTPIHQFTPVFAAESQGVRTLSDSVIAMPVSKPEAIGFGLLKALIESDVDRGVAALFGMTKVAGYLPAA
ncbi:VWA domain-containing protein [Roseiconus nitratireducens]|uniref:VWA domain-containing protein n=1 Tax=Roseiconus nitratireducens TaxID=2605748 RepID=A0A5M6CS12_9BACT|nr:VWA domain-containing protein [Roseiconus nitratireducens]KAA5538021.1 VWA domain-containing protein [Roseiconus nitratireducens]